ncbi:MAG: ParB/RepB/Spo0J family partition protein [Candidatus Yonathbacteria bacterium]|nr:ParB/RepB/Spo0J family partition protein [Candidatus Yonathbacteria bacterium]
MIEWEDNFLIMPIGLPNQMYQNSIFWIEIEKIKPNPFQPRKEFDEFKLRDLADSIKQYGILQPLVVTRREIEKPEGGLAVEYELIAGERRLRASKIAGLTQVPVLIRIGEEGREEEDRVKLELAIIENLQREDLNPIDRAKAFQRLADDFGFKHVQIAMKVGKSREYVSNTLRLLALPEEMQTALAERKITEGHTRPLLMLAGRAEEQLTLYKEIIFKKLNVREAERIARRIAVEKVRKLDRGFDPEILEFEQELTEKLGTRVQIEKREVGGKIVIDFFSNDDVRNFMKRLHAEMQTNTQKVETPLGETPTEAAQPAQGDDLAEGGEDVMEKDPDEDLYNVKNFSL